MPIKLLIELIAAVAALISFVVAARALVGFIRTNRKLRVTWKEMPRSREPEKLRRAS